MRFQATTIILATAAILAACGTTPTPREAFSESWEHRRAVERAEKERREAAKDRTIPIFGKRAKERAAVEVDEEGRPKLRLGEQDRVKVDLDLDGGKPEAGLEYRIRFGKKKRFKSQPQKPPTN